MNKLRIILLLVLSVIYSNSQAECVGCELYLIIVPGTIAVMDFATAGAPALFIDDNEDYSYWSSYSYGLLLGGAGFFFGALNGNFTDDIFTLPVAGLLLGNWLGYHNSRRPRAHGWHTTIQNNSLAVSYRF